MMKGWRIAALVLAFFTLVGGVSYLAMRTPKAPPRPPNLRRLTGTIVESLVYQATGEKFPRATCDACRIARKKIGVFTIGAFCTLEFDKLVVNLPTSRSDAGVASPNGPAGRCVSGSLSEKDRIDDLLVNTLGLRALAQASGRQKIPGIVGVTINQFEMNRMDGEELHPILRASSAHTEKMRVALRNATIYRGKSVEFHDRAWLTISPSLSVEWIGGRLALVGN